MAAKKRTPAKKKAAPRTAGSRSLDSYGKKKVETRKPVIGQKKKRKGKVGESVTTHGSHGGCRISSTTSRYPGVTTVHQKYEL